MEKIYILGNSSELNVLGNVITVPQLQSESEINDWVINLFSENDIDKIVIELSSDLNLNIQIAFHIRLTIDQLKEKCLIPILFISHQSINSIIQQNPLFAQLLSTSGIFFSEINVALNKIELENVYSLRENDYLSGFLKKIHIVPDETIGRHSLGNIWGAYILDKVSKANSLPKEALFRKKLYFKYITAFNSLNKLKPSRIKVLDTVELGNINKIPSEGKRILLIDDEAEKGWSDVLKKIFKTSSTEDFVVINEKIKDFESFSKESKEIIENSVFDLYLVDLRLNGTDEDENLNPSHFSGVKILKKIKSLNDGLQVIMFSASNKIWNLKTLLKEGADGYYLKESPEFNFPIKLSEQNYDDFKENVIACYQKDYLRKIYEQLSITRTAKNIKEQNVLEESTVALEIAWDLIKGGEDAYGFLTLFQFIESYANRLISYDQDTDSYYLKEKTLITRIDEKQNEWELTFNKDKEEGDYFKPESCIQDKNIKPTALFNISALLYYKFGHQAEELKKFGMLNKVRNGIAHGKIREVQYEQIMKILKIIEEIRNI